MSLVIGRLDRMTQHVLVHTGQNYDYELNQVFFQGMGIRRPDHFLAAAGGTAAETIGRVIAESDKVFAAERPDAVLIYGDTNSCLAAISAKRLKIPVFHMEAGNRCFDQRVPGRAQSKGHRSFQRRQHGPHRACAALLACRRFARRTYLQSRLSYGGSLGSFPR
jgi:UDP-N-acetylglucosamine 2-epimerase (non-hydrolysing)